MKKLLSILMMCVFTVVFTGIQLGCDANANSDDGPNVQNQTDVGAEETDELETP